MKQRTYIAIDLKSFYASVECRERGLNPLDANLVVADEGRTDKTICLAVTPSLKSYGISGRGRLFEVKQRVMSLAMRPNEVYTEVQYDCKVRHRAAIFFYTEVLNMRKNLTEIVFILDRSGSMSGLEADTIGGFNSMIGKQKKENGEALISTVLFDNVGEVIHDRVPVNKVEPMTGRDYSVRGCTALLDAIGGAIHHIGNVHKYARNEDVPEHTLFVITTDGMENASRRYDSEAVKKMIERQKKKYGWEFLFLGANIDAVETAKHFGIGADRAVNYHSDHKGTQLNYEVLSEAVSAVRCSVPLGTNWKKRIDEDYESRKDGRK